jgi:hypothetical protein
MNHKRNKSTQKLFSPLAKSDQVQRSRVPFVPLGFKKQALQNGETLILFSPLGFLRIE